MRKEKWRQWKEIIQVLLWRNVRNGFWGCQGRLYLRQMIILKVYKRKYSSREGNVWWTTEWVIAGVDKIRALSRGIDWDRSANIAFIVIGDRVKGTVEFLCWCFYFLREIRRKGISRDWGRGLNIRDLRREEIVWNNHCKRGSKLEKWSRIARKR